LSVWARGNCYRCTTEYCEGDPWTPETRPTWDRVAQKFHDFCGDFVDAQTIDEIVARIKALDAVANVSQELRLP
jgi:hypothetical protein